jgi:hypothetical protein
LSILVCPMLSVSLGCPFLITPSVFSSIYFMLTRCLFSVNCTFVTTLLLIREWRYIIRS